MGPKRRIRSNILRRTGAGHPVQEVGWQASNWRKRGLEQEYDEQAGRSLVNFDRRVEKVEARTPGVRSPNSLRNGALR